MPESANIKRFGRTFSSAQATGIQNGIVKMISIHWKNGCAAGMDCIDLSDKAFGNGRLAAARRTYDGDKTPTRHGRSQSE